jgi:hypothetical protein
MSSFGASDALIRKRSRGGLAAAVAVGVPLSLAALLEWTNRGDFQFIPAGIALVEAVFFFFLPALAPNGLLTGERRGDVRADKRGLWFRKRLLLARERIESVWVEKAPADQRCVHLCARHARDDVAITVDDDERVKSLLRALDLRHDRHAASFVVESAPLRAPRRQMIVRALVVLFGALLAASVVYGAYRTASVGFLLVPVLLAYSIILRHARLTTRVVVGADGIVVRVAGAVRHVRFEEVGSVTGRGRATTAVRLNGRSDEILLRFVGNNADQKSHAFSRRVQPNIGKGACGPGDHLAQLLLPSSRGLEEWLGELRRVTSGSEGYRGGALPDEDLWRIVESPSADAGARAGALASLGPRLDDVGRVRIGEIAGGTAHRPIRVALEAAAAGESDEAILAAFLTETERSDPKRG